MTIKWNFMWDLTGHFQFFKNSWEVSIMAQIRIRTGGFGLCFRHPGLNRLWVIIRCCEHPVWGEQLAHLLLLALSEILVGHRKTGLGEVSGSRAEHFGTFRHRNWVTLQKWAENSWVDKEKYALAKDGKQIPKNGETYANLDPWNSFSALVVFEGD